MSNETREGAGTLMVFGRVLRAGVLCGQEVKPDDLFAVPAAEAEGLVADGAIDTSEAAVAYARSLVAPAAAAEPVLEAQTEA